LCKHQPNRCITIGAYGSSRARSGQGCRTILSIEFKIAHNGVLPGDEQFLLEPWVTAVHCLSDLSAAVAIWILCLKNLLREHEELLKSESDSPDSKQLPRLLLGITISRTRETQVLDEFKKVIKAARKLVQKRSQAPPVTRQVLQTQLAQVLEPK
jgi:hypothetical protein